MKTQKQHEDEAKQREHDRLAAEIQEKHRKKIVAEGKAKIAIWNETQKRLKKVDPQ
jgi:hypothetical protein